MPTVGRIGRQTGGPMAGRIVILLLAAAGRGDHACSGMSRPDVDHRLPPKALVWSQSIGFLIIWSVMLGARGEVRDFNEATSGRVN